MPLFRFLLTGIAKMLSKVFSMATLTFFGRVPSKDDSKISLMGLLSLYWVYVLVSIFFPKLAKYFIPFLAEDESIIRMISATILVVLPLLIGYMSSKLENRDKGKSTLKQMVMGYPYTFILGILSTFLLIFIPMLKIPNMMKGHIQTQFALMVEEGKYDDVLEDVCLILNAKEIETSIHSPRKTTWTVFMTLSYVLEHIFNRQMAKKMKYIYAVLNEKKVVITLHATDLSILGERDEVYYMKHLLSEELEPNHLYFSWDDSVQKIEDRIKKYKHLIASHSGEGVKIGEIEELATLLREKPLSNEDWNAVRRQIYKLERDYYKRQRQKDRSSELT
ncbi:hypothetical protein LGQ02_16400 [Bacillus shivajii]|uniref:hypothetical protein n=1 Tax=Bacillus shivajii TaxID=1983719 RepID=UPI001CFAAA41|nr:hypothetical protein [Bacillus shivajii]UCZ52405.1 hypothetical protein LGQ02_16400 [Bacillus shivajii]